MVSAGTKLLSINLLFGTLPSAVFHGISHWQFGFPVNGVFDASSYVIAKLLLRERLELVCTFAHRFCQLLVSCINVGLADCRRCQTKRAGTRNENSIRRLVVAERFEVGSIFCDREAKPANELGLPR
jgi:hypothetical protein